MTTALQDRVLVTGISGFIAKHVAAELLDAGYLVRGTVRSAAKGEAARQALTRAGADVSRLEIVVADLTRDDGWDSAVDGCRFVQHTASPFPAAQPRNKFALVPVAEGGTLRVVNAAIRAGVERLVLTSSVVAVYHGHENRKGARFDERDFSNVDSPAISAYAVSKTLAEKAAWRAVEHEEMELSVINPSLVLGPLLDDDAGTSTSIVAMMMKGLLPVVPDARFGVVDVRDVAAAHLSAMTLPEAAGRRFIVTSEPMSLREIAAVVAEAHPELRRRLPRFTLPDPLVFAAAAVSRRAATLAAELDPNRSLDNGAARETLGLIFRPAHEAVLATTESLIRHGLVGRPSAS